MLFRSVSYARARAESIEVEAKLGIAERTDRLLVAILGAVCTDFGWGLWWLVLGLGWVAFASFITVIQRIVLSGRWLGRPTWPFTRAGRPQRARIHDETERVLPTRGPVPLRQHLYSFTVYFVIIYSLFLIIYFLAGRMPVPSVSRTKRPTMPWSFSDVSAMR